MSERQKFVPERHNTAWDLQLASWPETLKMPRELKGTAVIPYLSHQVMVKRCSALLLDFHFHGKWLRQNLIHNALHCQREKTNVTIKTLFAKLYLGLQ